MIISDDVRTVELFLSVKNAEGKEPPLRMAALREMYTDGLLAVRPLSTLNDSENIWKPLKECVNGHAHMAVHYFDRKRVTEAPSLELTNDRKNVYWLEAKENDGE